MPTVDLPYPQQGKDDKETIRNLTDVVVRLRKELEFLLQSLDHDNVKQLYTEYCQITSEAGETQISGPLILMYDKQEPPVLRRRIGYDPDSTLFVDEWYNPSGVLTAYIDSNGKLIVVDGEFKGTIDIGSGNFTVDASGNVTVKTDMTVGNNLYVGLGVTGDKKIQLTDTVKFVVNYLSNYLTVYASLVDLPANTVLRGKALATQEWVTDQNYVDIGDVAFYLSGFTYATESYVDDAIAAHVAAYHP
jgi:hypothetical protein